MFLMNIIKRIRTKVLGVTQADFAEAAGVVQTTVSRWESGGREPSRAELARLLERFPSLTPAEFFKADNGAHTP